MRFSGLLDSSLKRSSMPCSGELNFMLNFCFFPLITLIILWRMNERMNETENIRLSLLQLWNEEPAKKGLHNSKVIQFRRIHWFLRQNRTEQKTTREEEADEVLKRVYEKNFMNKIEIFILDKFKLVQSVQCAVCTHTHIAQQ